MIEARDGVFKALPLDLSDPAKYQYIIDRLVEHESEWTDFQSDMQTRKHAAASYFAKHILGENVILEVWQKNQAFELVGLLGFTHIVMRTDAQFHPVFFDGKIRNVLGKREILLRAMDWAFQKFDLHRLSVNLPENRYGLVKYVRSKLGFRFEGENRNIKVERVVPHGHLKSRKIVALTPDWRDAEIGSRKYQAVRQGGRWLDLLLLSVTREEFAQFVEVSCPVSLNNQVPSKPSPAT